ncbi:nuclear transport factor 2 family protein [uncultured Amnibacterium sp.]|uniref:nuclear transport factor 2 family protein n=1 Tax=uncultured Amnibacterium sp. TaxID=1631851 RepID=UPI0035CAB2DF
MSSRDAVDDWIHRYLVAWDSNDPDDVRAIFTPDAAYRFHPWDEPLRGVDAIIAQWTGEARDEAGDHAFTWSVIAVDGPTAVVQGRTRYDDGDVYDNLWVIELTDDGLARAFTEWYMEPPKDQPQG